MLCRILIFCGVVAAVVTIKINNDRIADLKKRLGDIQTQLQSDEPETRSNQLKQIIESIPNKNTRKEDVIEASFLCGLCNSIFNEFLNMRRVQKQSDKFLKNLALELCVDFEVQSEEVCHGLIELNAPSIFYIVDNRPKLSADTVCKLLLNDGDCLNAYTDDNLDFVVDIDNRMSSDIKKNFEEHQKQVSEDLTFIHISDIHVDFKYMKGAFADCDELACCRETDDVNENDPESNAGYWGDYRSCDSPLRAINDTFHQIRRQHSKIDAIYFTGDIVDHFMWDSSMDDMKFEIEKVYNLMSAVFSDIPVYPILGNHEAQNIFPPEDLNVSSLSVQWLYEHVRKQMLQNRFPPNAKNVTMHSGYYTTLIRPGLRLIALNNNVCYTFNWWISYEVKTIQKQFQWLHDVLLASEIAGEKVHILAHIPNGDDDYHQPCSREFRRIVDRFHQTITGQFNGHKEYFGFNIFFKNNNESLPINMVWNGGGISTFTGVNRNYVAYSVDPVSNEVKDVESWIYNLTAANQNDMESPIWYKQFSLRDAFTLKDLSPSTINNFVKDLPANSSASEQLWRMKIKDSDLMLRGGCQKACVHEILCDTLIADNNDMDKCQRIKKDAEAVGRKKISSES